MNNRCWGEPPTASTLEAIMAEEEQREKEKQEREEREKELAQFENQLQLAIAASMEGTTDGNDDGSYQHYHHDQHHPTLSADQEPPRVNEVKELYQDGAEPSEMSEVSEVSDQKHTHQEQSLGKPTSGMNKVSFASIVTGNPTPGNPTPGNPATDNLATGQEMYQPEQAWQVSAVGTETPKEKPKETPKETPKEKQNTKEEELCEQDGFDDYSFALQLQEEETASYVKSMRDHSKDMGKVFVRPNVGQEAVQHHFGGAVFNRSSGNDRAHANAFTPSSNRTRVLLSAEDAERVKAEEEEEEHETRNGANAFRELNQVSEEEGAASEILEAGSNQWEERDTIVQTQQKNSNPFMRRDKSLKGQGGNAEIITVHDKALNEQRNVGRVENVTGARAGNLMNVQKSNASAGSIGVPNTVYNDLKHTLTKQTHMVKGLSNTVEKDAKQTHSKGMDQKTRLLLHRMVNTGLLDEVHGVVKRGKEAVVFHAVGPRAIPKEAMGSAPYLVEDFTWSQKIEDGGFTEGGNQHREIAIKIFKTTLNEFKNRIDYMRGDNRFKNLGKLSHQNPQKIVAVWSEREFKNLTRLHKAGILCPEPIRLQDNVMLMQFIGRNTWAAPQLGQAPITSMTKFKTIYVQLVLIMRAMYQICQLVHADLSEYNVLVGRKSRCVIIDVGQAVRCDHPLASEFLDRDCQNVNKFFKSKGLAMASLSDTVGTTTASAGASTSDSDFGPDAATANEGNSAAALLSDDMLADFVSTKSNINKKKSKGKRNHTNKRRLRNSMKGRNEEDASSDNNDDADSEGKSSEEEGEEEEEIETEEEAEEDGEEGEEEKGDSGLHVESILAGKSEVIGELLTNFRNAAKDRGADPDEVIQTLLPCKHPGLQTLYDLLS